MTISVQLLGGLGNQLFGYFAGKYLSERLSTKLVLDLSKQEFNSHHQSSILDFSFVSEEVRWDSNLPVAERLINLIPPRFPGLQIRAEKYFKYYASKTIGFDSRLESLQDGVTITGYFQTHRYFSALEDFPALGPMSLVSPSSWFSEMADRVRKTRPIMIHIRRGDYLDAVNHSMGTLSQHYFESAFELLKEDPEYTESPIWIFSDSISMARQEAHGIPGEVFVVDAPLESTAAENLTLFSMGSSHIISNSTFSYWGATFSQRQKVIAPNKWFRQLDDPRELIPSKWKTSTSTWI
jgi:hypothetical protein